MTRLRGVVDVRRDTIDPALMHAEVDHFSIPALDATGGPERVERESIDSHKVLLRGGEVLVSRLNPRKPRVHLVGGRPTVMSVASTEFVPLRPTRVEPRYLRYLLLSETVRQHLDARVRSATRSHQRVEPIEILNLEVPVEGEEEQRRIADFLDERVALIDPVVAAREQEALRGNDARDAAWTAATLGLAGPRVPLRRFLMSIADGPFGSSLTSSHYADRGTRVIRLGNLGIAAFKGDDEAYISDDYAAVLRQHAVLPGDLLMAGLGDDRWPLGRCAVAPIDLGPAIVKADCYRIRLDDRVDHGFAAAFLSSPPSRAEISLLSRGATRARLNTDVARSAPLVVVDASTQAAYLRDVERMLQERARVAQTIGGQIQLLQEYKQSLITAAVTGEFDVTTASTRIPGES